MEQMQIASTMSLERPISLCANQPAVTARPVLCGRKSHQVYRSGQRQPNYEIENFGAIIRDA